MRNARFGADREDGRARLRRDGAALRARLGVDKGARRRIDLVVAQNERRPSADDEVELVVAVLFAVLLDDALVALLGRVRVRAESRDSEPPPDGSPEQPLVVDREAVELVQVRYFVCLLAQVLLLRASRTTGSICSTPSTRSSRFSFPVHWTNVSASSPS